MGKLTGQPCTAQPVAGATREAAMAVGQPCGNLGAAPWGATLSVEKPTGSLGRSLQGQEPSSSVRSELICRHKP